jgi:hypothetical protein
MNHGTIGLLYGLPYVAINVRNELSYFNIRLF